MTRICSGISWRRTAKNYQFRIAADGKTTIKVLDSKGKPMNNELTIPVIFTVEETMPDGKTISRKIIPESLESSQPATMKPKNLSFKGKATGDLGFEVFVSEERGGILLGGHLLNPAELKNPTRFSIEVKIPNAKPKVKADAEKTIKKPPRKLERKIKDDKVQLILTDGKKVKITGDEAVEGSSKEVTGPGISAASIEFSAFKEEENPRHGSPELIDAALQLRQAAPHGRIFAVLVGGSRQGPQGQGPPRHRDQVTRRRAALAERVCRRRNRCRALDPAGDRDLQAHAASRAPP